MDRPTGQLGYVVGPARGLHWHLSVEFDDGVLMDVARDRIVPAPRLAGFGWYRKEEVDMTYTVSKLSGKALRLMARYLAVLEMGGKLIDTPEEFWDRLLRETHRSQKELERDFEKHTDVFEERLREEEGFLGDQSEVAAFVRAKLKEGFLRDGEVAADHRSEPSSPKPKPRPSTKEGENIIHLIKRLRSCKDPAEARQLRRALRKAGHRGGLRS